MKRLIGQPGRENVLLREAAASASQIEPEFIDVDGVRRGFGIKRSLAYELLKDGAIKGVSLRRRNRVRGKRLFQVDSIRAYLSSRLKETASNGGTE